MTKTIVRPEQPDLVSGSPVATLLTGDCLFMMQTMEPNSVDAIVTDPPYGLKFMGKKWDYDVPGVDIWRECLRVLKPGGHLLAFAGTRTQHRMCVNIEDAGFEIRDMLAWIYGSGFPKSLDIGKGIDKTNAETGRELKFTKWMRGTGVTAGEINTATNTQMGSHYITQKSQPAIPTRELFEKIRPLVKWPVPSWVDELVERQEAEREKVGEETKARSSSGGSALPTCGGSTEYRTWDITAPATPEAKQWDGWGTALKPALEPITLARKPLGEKTVAANVLEHGTGGLNVGACRVGNGLDRSSGGLAEKGSNFQGGRQTARPIGGRFPANLIHDGSPEVTALFPESKSTGGITPGKGDGRRVYNHGYGKDYIAANSGGLGDSGSAARFFYCAKASKADRDEGLEVKTTEGMRSNAGPALVGEDRARTMQRNNHPTVKPTALMQYLCRLITPPGGKILDPFMGSGSTGKAAMKEGFDFIGCELNPEYVEIAKRRIESA